MTNEPIKNWRSQATCERSLSPPNKFNELNQRDELNELDEPSKFNELNESYWQFS